MRRLKPSEVKEYREELLEAQCNTCALCGLPVLKEEAVADHDHNSGLMRGVLHRGCNSLLGKIENNWRRCGVLSLTAFVEGCGEYLATHADFEPANDSGVYHPSYRTPEEKRLLRNKRARRKRKAARGQ